MEKELLAYCHRCDETIATKEEKLGCPFCGLPYSDGPVKMGQKELIEALKGRQYIADNATLYKSTVTLYFYDKAAILINIKVRRPEILKPLLRDNGLSLGPLAPEVNREILSLLLEEALIISVK